ncbi:rhodanese-like domain-containing protein [Sulfodiicoccus acidiphilus]|nr:rhodanese-like domain-containing protein [Sulfodiicoccus acidiphilus]
MVVENTYTPYYNHIVYSYPSDVRRLWKQGKVLMLDIRTPQEYVAHHVPGSVLIPMDYLEELSHYFSDKEVAVICEHGNRAYYATFGMPHLYRRRAYYLAGGLQAWMYMGYEVVRGLDEGAKVWKELLNSQSVRSRA